MLLLLYPLCLVLLCVTGYVAIPADVRALIGENCRNSKGRLTPKYVFGELKSVAGFFAQTLFAATIVAVLCLIALVMVDDYLNLEIVGKAVGVADVDPEVWKENLASKPSSIRDEFTRYHVGQGGTKESAQNLMRFLWYAIPIAVAATFIGLVLCLRMTSRSYNTAIQQLVENEVRLDRRRASSRYLRHTAQSKTDWHEGSSREQASHQNRRLKKSRSSKREPN